MDPSRMTIWNRCAATASRSKASFSKSLDNPESRPARQWIESSKRSEPHGNKACRRQDASSGGRPDQTDLSRIARQGVAIQSDPVSVHTAKKGRSPTLFARENAIGRVEQEHLHVVLFCFAGSRFSQYSRNISLTSAEPKAVVGCPHGLQ